MGKSRILVTGANGFIGKYLCKALWDAGFDVRAAVRKIEPAARCAFDVVEVRDIAAPIDWSKALSGVDAIVHLAAHVHLWEASGMDFLESFRRVNVAATERLAKAAAEASAKRFVYVSTVKVNGEGSERVYTENDTPEPEDAYGVSKWEAESALASVARDTGLPTVVLRPPLVYGSGVKANFDHLIKLVRSGLPLPFKGLRNRRSFIYLGNLADAIKTCLTHPAAVGQTFMVSDGQDVSTADLIGHIARALNKSPRFFYIPPELLKTLCRLMGQRRRIEKFTKSLSVDISKIKGLLNWTPPYSFDEGIRETVREFLPT